MERNICEFVIIALCVSLVFIPASASDFTLGIFGNANMDDTIDGLDMEYVQGIIDEVNEPTRLADVNYDGVIDEKDMAQIELIIDGQEKKLTFVQTTSGLYIDSDDNADRIVTIDEPVTKIIAVYSNVGEAIRALGAKNRVIGVDGKWFSQYSQFFPDLVQKPYVGGAELDIEAIIELEPDIVIIPKWHTPDLEDKLKGTGIDVARIEPNEIETLKSEILLLGYILNEVENATNYIEWHDSYVDNIVEIVSGIPEDEKITVFLDGTDGGVTEREDMSDHFTTWKNAGGKSITNISISEQRFIETELILDQNPDVIIGCRFDGGYQTDDESSYGAHYEEIVGLPGFETLNAVSNDRVYVIYGRLGMGLHAPIGIAYAAKWLYPDLFEDLDPQVIHQEYINRFCPGLDFDVSEHGVFVYSPQE